jgi:uncharacterized protein
MRRFKVRESEGVTVSMREMRRKDREMARGACIQLLDEALVGRAATVGEDGAPYVVPMNFVYDSSSNTIFLHCATSGQLLDNLASNPRVCFEVDEPGAVVMSGPDACDASQVYKSVICFGRASVIDRGQEKQDALERFAQKYIDRLMRNRKYEPELRTIDTTVAIAIQVETMTGKQRSEG